MGGGATGQLAAAYLQMRFPSLKVAVVEGPHKNRPIVGESFVEITVDFLLELGLGPHLIEKHYPKYGLTYYFKPDIDDPADRTYVVDEAPTVPPLLSFQVNRFTLDSEVRQRNVANGVHLIDGTVAGVNLNEGDGLHTVTVQDPAQQRYEVRARWLIDATGRNRVLAKLLQLHEPVKEQKNVFWFRLTNFDPGILGRSLLRDSSFLWKGQLDLVHPHALAGQPASNQRRYHLPQGRLSVRRGPHDGAVPAVRWT